MTLFRFKSKFLLVLGAYAALSLTGCNTDEQTTEELYKDWKEYNQNWLAEQIARKDTDGSPYYTRVNMPTDPQGYVLMHTIGDTHPANLKPLYTSTTKVNYTLTLANDSVLETTAGYVSQLSSSNLITGWGLAIMQLHVGDSAQFVIPYNMAYGTTGTTSISPYTNLQFNIKLVDITGYEIRP